MKEQTCCSSHNNHHEHEHEHHHEHTTDGCGCGHEHTVDTSKQSKILFVIAIILAILSLFIKNPMIQTSGFLIATLLCGYPLFKSGLQSILKLRFDEFMLLTVAVVTAFIIGESIEAVIVTMLFRIGQMLEQQAIDKSRKEITALTNIRPDTANLITQNDIQVVKAEEIAIGSLILVKAGERVPLDCEVITGTSVIDTSALTGESVAKTVEVGDSILSGSINLSAVLHCKTITSFENSAASRIIKLVEDSAKLKGNTEKFITKFSKVYTPIVMILALCLAIIPSIFAPENMAIWISRSLVFLVASCPCALVISVPLSFYAGIGAASKKGVLVKGSRYIEALAKVNTVVFDKTGTLTTGNLSVSQVVSLSELSEQALLRVAGISESLSNHPIAKAIVNHCGDLGEYTTQNYQDIVGKGVSLLLDGKAVLCGSNKLMLENGIDTSHYPSANIYIAQEGILLGYITVFDNPRADAKELIQKLKTLGVSKTVMLTGDAKKPADAVKQACDVDICYSELLPEDKVNHLSVLKNQLGTVVFVGDGINDAPVLACADVGVAMGFGSDAAIEAADTVLLSDNLSSLSDAIIIAKQTTKTARFNIIFALSIKAVVLILGALGLAAMWVAVFADVGVSILAVLNATKILRKK